MGSVGDAYDNAMAESFFASLECELLSRHGLRSKAETRMAIFEWIEGWYNSRRRHSALGYLSPNDFETRLRTPHDRKHLTVHGSGSTPNVVGPSALRRGGHNGSGRPPTNHRTRGRPARVSSADASPVVRSVHCVQAFPSAPVNVRAVGDGRPVAAPGAGPLPVPE